MGIKLVLIRGKYIKMKIVPIGIQCTNATFLKQQGKKTFTYPFDWMFSSPKFVYDMLFLLLEEKTYISNLVTDHFFLCDQRAFVRGAEHYFTDRNGNALLNGRHQVIFPHDKHDKETIQKYIRRFERLKELILNDKEDMCLVYVSPSSDEGEGHFTINGKSVLHNVYMWLNKIYDLVSKYKPVKMIVFDSIQKQKEEPLNEKIILRKLNKCRNWPDMIPQMVPYLKDFEDLE